eukprot:scaffold29225_cov40-Attheya_sp.AAC.5
MAFTVVSSSGYIFLSVSLSSVSAARREQYGFEFGGSGSRWLFGLLCFALLCFALLCFERLPWWLVGSVGISAFWCWLGCGMSVLSLFRER